MNKKTITKAVAMFAAATVAIGATLPEAANAEDAYVESDGTSVVNAGVMPDPNLRLEIDYALTTTSQRDVRIVGVEMSGGQNVEFYVNQTGGLAFMVGKGWPGGKYLVMPDTKRHMFIADIPAKKVYLVTGVMTNATGEMHTSSPIDGRGIAPIGLFGRITGAHGSSNKPELCTKVRVYGARFFKNGALVRNLVPCVKGDMAGFRDTIGGTFHTGEFNVGGLSAGGDVERIPDDGYIELTGNDQMKAAGSKGGHYINTGYTPGPNTRIELDYALAANRDGSGDWYALCAGNTSANNAFALYGTASSFRFCIGTNMWADTTLPAQTNACNVRRTIVLDGYNSVATLRTSGYTNYATTNSSPWLTADMSTTLRIGENPSGNGWGFAPVRIYGLRIFESDNLVREYVPFVKNGAPGLKYGNTFVKVSLTADNGKDGLPRAGGNVAVSSERDRDAYVLFTGSQTLDTGYTPNSGTKIVADFGFANAHNNPQQILFDASSGLYCRIYTQNSSGTDAKYSWLLNKAWSVLHSGIAVDHQRRLLTIDSPNNQTSLAPGATDGSVFNGNSTIANWNRDATSAHTLVIGSLAVPDASKGYLYARTRIYRFTIYDGGAKVREYVPCVIGGVAGLYDLVNGGVPLTASGLTVSGRGHEGAEEWITTPPAETTIRVESSATIAARAVGAHRYVWTRDGEEIAGETGESLTVEWTRGDYDAHTYTVTAIYDVFGTETAGTPQAFSVQNNACAFFFIVR